VAVISMDIYDLEAAELDRDVRRARVASTYATPPTDDEAVAYAKRKVEEERFLAAPGRPRTKPLQPDGLGFLQRILDETRPQNHPNLAAFTRFQALLVRRTTRGRSKPSHEDVARLADLSQRDPLDVVKMPWRGQATAGVVEIITKLAVTAHVAPATVLDILVCYGLEHLTAEIRARGAAPPVRLPPRRTPDTPTPPPTPKTFIIGS
jgi:hypothetical protein